MEQEQTVEQPKIQTDIPKITLIIGLFLFALSIGSSFFGGYYLQKILSTNENLKPSLTPMPTNIQQKTESPEGNSSYIKDKQYFDDTIMAMTDSTPHKILIATATRQEIQSGANQATRVSFFDGQKWIRKTQTKHHDTAAIYTNDIITAWKINIDPSRVLKQNVQGLIQIDQNNINFDTGNITNNIGVRSLPGYTKFMSTGNGSLTVNGTLFNAKILYTRIYSNNSQEIQFYDTPFGLTTYWLAFWDTNGNFYHIDSTNVDKPTDKYQTHELGVFVNQDGQVNKTFDVKVTSNSDNPPSSYQIQLGAPINRTLQFTTQSSINKAPNNSYSWFMSNGTGQIENISGFGLAEYIHN